MTYFTAKEKVEYYMHHLSMLMKIHPGPMGIQTEIEVIATIITCSGLLI